jgi:TRAP-type C4-dicarboxylate transport system permease small subunit
MERARKFMQWLTKLESALAVAGLGIAAAALVSDIAARELFRQGLFGSLRVAVYAAAVAALLGFSLCIAAGTHLRVTIFDGVTPERWRPAVARIGDLIALSICCYFAYWAIVYVNQTRVLGETDPSLNIKVWPIQSALAWMFISGAIRYALFFAFPGLRPQEQGPAS